MFLKTGQYADDLRGRIFLVRCRDLQCGRWEVAEPARPPVRAGGFNDPFTLEGPEKTVGMDGNVEILWLFRFVREGVTVAAFIQPRKGDDGGSNPGTASVELSPMKTIFE